MIELKENMGIPRSIVIAMAVLAGVTVANLYYNQPLLKMISSDLGISHITANLITVITQVGYAFGLFFIIPSGDLYSRRRIISVCMTMAAVMSLIIGLAKVIYTSFGERHYCLEHHRLFRSSSYPLQDSSHDPKTSRRISAMFFLVC